LLAPGNPQLLSRSRLAGPGKHQRGNAGLCLFPANRRLDGGNFTPFEAREMNDPAVPSGLDLLVA
jgi:hypothetical protein